jgi:hypothetical protein
LDLDRIVESYGEERGYPPDFAAVTAIQRPDFRTISEFRKRHCEALSGLFVQVLRLVGPAEQITTNLAAAPEQISADTGYCSEENPTALESREIDAHIASGQREHGAAAAPHCKAGWRRWQQNSALPVIGGLTRLRKRVVEPLFGQIIRHAVPPIPAARLCRGAERMVADLHRA